MTTSTTVEPVIAASSRAIMLLDPAFGSAAVEELSRLVQGYTKPSDTSRRSHQIVRRGKIHVQMTADPNAVLAWAIAQRIRAARERAGWTQADLTARSGIARPNITRLERGQHVPSLTTLRTVAEILNVSLPALLTSPQTGYDPEDREIAEAGITDWADALEREDNAP